MNIRNKQGHPLRVLHVLSRSLPHLNGYTVRGKYIVRAQRDQGLEPIVVTSPFYPDGSRATHSEVIDGTTYFRIQHPFDEAQRWSLESLALHWGYRLIRSQGLWKRAWHVLQRIRAAAGTEGGNGPNDPDSQPRLGLLDRLSIRPYVHAVAEKLLLRRFRCELLELARQLQPDLLHAHTPYWCGTAALHVRRLLGIPLLYEVRGLWEESAVAEGRFTRGDRAYRAWQRNELAVMRQADVVVCICEQLRRLVIQRGVPSERVFVAPNAADPALFQPAPSLRLPHGHREAKARLRGTVLGYVGSLRKLEGVDGLIRAGAELLSRGEDVSLLIVGNGTSLKELQALAAQLGISEKCVFTGQVPHAEIPAWYGLIDVFVVSRPPLRVTEMVTPLKPLEAMAMGKALVVSDLPALREIVQQGKTGLYYRAGDLRDLANQCGRLIHDGNLRRRLGQQARAWVRRERTWATVIGNLEPAYRMALRRLGLEQTAGRLLEAPVDSAAAARSPLGPLPYRRRAA